MPQVEPAGVKEKRPRIKVRVRHYRDGALLPYFPYPWAAACHSLNVKAMSRFHFSIPIVPRSLNSQYIRTRKGFQYGLVPEIIELRNLTKQAVAKLPQWKPMGAISAVILFYSPQWVTKDGHIRGMDVDNKIKAVLDAWQIASGIGDERVWSVMAGKILSSEKKTEVHLFDMGDVIDSI